MATDALPRQPRSAPLRRPFARTQGALWLGRLAIPAVVAGIWALLAVTSDLVPTIGSSVAALIDGFESGWIVAPLSDTLQAVFWGFVLAAAVALPLGFLLGRSRFLGQMVDPIITGTFAVPRIILYPVLLALFGVGWTAKLWMAAVSAFFPIVMLTAVAIREVEPTLIKLGRSMNCTASQMIRKIFLPAAAPSVMVGLRIGLSIAFVSVIVAELFATVQGLGLLISRAYGFQQLPRMFGVVLLVVVIALAGNLALWWLERRLRATID